MVCLYSIFFEISPSEEFQEILLNGLSDQAFLKKKLLPMRHFGFSVKDATGKIIGGAIGLIFYGCLYTDSLFIPSKIRKKGFGQTLMQNVEQYGKEHGCTFACVNTMDFEALGFYQSLGYEIEFERKGFSGNSILYFLRKSL